MILPYPNDPASLSQPNPLFNDNAFVRGDQFRLNNQRAWANMNYLLDTLALMPNNRKELGETFFLNDLREASSDFPAICLARDNATIWKTGNPLGSGNIPGNFPDLVDYLRAIPIRYNPFASNDTEFLILSWEYTGTTITITFTYTTPKGTKESKVVRSLHEDAFVHNLNDTIGFDYSAFEPVTDWRTITLVDPLRDDSNNIQVPTGTYQITEIKGGEDTASQIKFEASTTPTGTPNTESRLVKFYPYRIQDSGANFDSNSVNKALHFAVNGRGFVTVDNTDLTEWVGGLRRRDRLQGFDISGHDYGTDGGGGVHYPITGASNGHSLHWYLSSDGTNGVPRLSNTTDSRGLGLYPYIWAKRYV